ncbi:MAG: SDR family oxidoreductase [Bacteroidia bacterium]
MKEPVLILGATSDIARAFAHACARQGHPLLLAARQPDRLEADVQDLKLRYGVEVSAWAFDARAYDTHVAFWTALTPRPGVVVCVFGYLGAQAQAEQDWQMAQEIIDVNYTGAASILHHAARDMEAQGRGVIIGISSVAGDRGRASNYYYGSAKAGFTAYLSGLRNRLASKGVHVLTVKPGFVDTAMTAGLPLPKPLVAQPARVAQDIYRAMQRRRNVLYTLGVWRLIMLIIRHIPEGMFKKMKL